MGSFQTFERDIKLATAGFSPSAMRAELARFAKAELVRVQSTGEAPKSYEKFINGRRGADESTVELPGPILYLFSYWTPVITFALKYLQDRSPKRSGTYARSHFAMVNGTPVNPADDVPFDAEVIITNRVPYTRKIEVGAMKMNMPPGVYDAARLAIRKEFGGANGLLDIKVKFLLLPSPYILKHDQGRKGRNAGDPLTYPSLVMNMRV